MKGVGNEKRELCLRMCGRRRILGAGEQMREEPGAKSCDVLVAVKGVRFRRGVDRNGMSGRRVG